MNSFNVLIIDDDKDINEILEFSFDDFNLKVQSKDKSKINILKCYQGKDGVNVVEDFSKNNTKVDLIVLDMLMPPGIDGLEVLKQLKGINKNLNIIISSAYYYDSNHEVVDLSKEFTQVYYLQKPYDLELFMDLVRAILLEDKSFIDGKSVTKFN